MKIYQSNTAGIDQFYPINPPEQTSFNNFATFHRSWVSIRKYPDPFLADHVHIQANLSTEGYHVVR